MSPPRPKSVRNAVETDTVLFWRSPPAPRPDVSSRKVRLVRLVEPVGSPRRVRDCWLRGVNARRPRACSSPPQLDRSSTTGAARAMSSDSWRAAVATAARSAASRRADADHGGAPARGTQPLRDELNPATNGVSKAFGSRWGRHSLRIPLGLSLSVHPPTNHYNRLGFPLTIHPPKSYSAVPRPVRAVAEAGWLPGPDNEIL